MLNRKIIHIDMDAFYASIEQRDFPNLQGKPVAVGQNHNRGVVAAASYEARKYGVKSAMSSVVAVRQCPDLVFCPPRFEIYKEVSKQLHEIFFNYTDYVEPLSLDEAYLDVTIDKKGINSASLIANQIRKEIKEKLNLNSSAGVSYNKFLAKIASDYNKPNGFCLITPEQGASFVEKLPIERFFGIGKATAKKMHKLGVFYGKDLKKFDLSSMIQFFGKTGHAFYNMVRGIDERPVICQRIRKSVGVERTYSEDLNIYKDVLKAFKTLCKELVFRMERGNYRGRTITIKVRYSDFDQFTRSKTIENSLIKNNELYDFVINLFQEKDLKKDIRLLGVSISNLDNIEKEIYKIGVQLTLNFEKEF
ncbi:MAG: DNA polymerase IV [Bacteroidales bacterium]